ncbi:MAG TPA: TonB-dependent receptor [Pyrinomonadaceae bacterium]|nr:TonB-dependent receptor [Pyrinomonadaceae bacterium]
MKTQSFKTSSGLAVWCGVVLVFLMCCFSAMAQSSTSSVTGSVVDPQKNVIPGATVTLTNREKNFTRTQTTTDNGSFAFSLIPPGQYQIEAEAKGFKKSVLTDVGAQVAKPTTVIVELEVGIATETVTVSSGAGEVLVNKEDGTLGNNFINQQITQLPLEARSPLALVTLQPAVTREGYVAGARSDQSNITLDGIDINEAQTNSVGSPVIRLNAEAIEEFRVTTVNANAAAGRSSGAQISLVSKSGSNDWHGALFLANRNTSTSANDFFNNRAGVARPKLIRNTYGGAIGGPILKDRFFFFYSYEGRKDISETAVTRTVPLASLGRGELRYVNPSGGITTLTTAQLNGIFSAAQMNPVAIAALRDAATKYPANDFTTGDSSASRLLNTAGFRFNAPTPVRLNSHSGRFDYNLTDKQQLFLRANIIYDLTGGVPQFPDTPAPNLWEHPWGFVAGHTWTINSKFVNNFRFGITREAFSQQGDSAENSISFRFVFSPRRFLRTLNRTTPVQNFTDDFSWTSGNHSMQFGTNVRRISNVRSSFANAYDNAITNPSFYIGGGGSISSLVNAFSPIGAGFAAAVQNATTALIGRYSQYSALFTFDNDGSVLAPGSSADRDFRANEYDVYGQDVWRVGSSLTVTYGLRYSISTPIWENNGFETTTSIPLTTYFERRLAGAAAGKPYNELISLQLSGKKNGKPPLYNWDKNNFQPRIALAWSPKFEGGFFGKLFGTNSESVFRGGFGITNDYYGQQLAVSFDLNNALGFSSSRNINANTYSVTGSNRPLAPLFTGYGQDVRSLPNITVPGKLTFPQTAPMTFARPIQSSLDSALVAPIHYSWNATFERELPKGMVLQLSYIGRSARNLIASRDVMTLNNLVDPKSGMDWYTAAGILEDMRRRGVPVSQVPQIPYFANLFPANLAQLMNDNYWGEDLINTAFNQTQAVYANTDPDIYGNDWTDIQDVIDQAVNGGLSTLNNLFFQPQYGALSSFSSIANSNYHAATVSLRERLGTSLTMDFNYTWSHSLDDASGLATSGAFGGAFIHNPILQKNSYANSDFDIRHIVNVNGIWQLPIGKGRMFLGDSNKVVDGILGGWQLSGIFRWNSGLPTGFYGASGPYDDARWATNWNVQSNLTRIREIETCPTRGSGNAPPKLFGCSTVDAYRSFRNARPGESGDRNVFRVPGYVNLDMGLGKSFRMPWSEGHKLQIRVEAFNITNTQRLGQFDTSRTGFGMVLDPEQASPPTNWSNFTAIQGSPRVFQFGFRYEF